MALTSPGFDTLQAARRSVYSMIGDTVSFVNSSAWQQGSAGAVASRDVFRGLVQQRRLLSQLKSWRSACDSLSAPARALEAFAILEAHVTLAELWVKAAPERSESAFGAERPAFAWIVACASAHISQEHNRHLEGAPFNFELGWVTPLFYTALKCRDTSLRKQAVSLLSCLPGLEGIWQGDRLASLAKRVVEREMGDGELFQRVAAGPAYTEDGKVKFKAHYTLSEPDDSTLARTFSEVLVLSS